MKQILNKCPVCGGKIEYNQLMQYSHNYRIKQNGQLSVNYYKEDHGSMDCGFISCINPECDFVTDCDLNSENHSDIKIWQKEERFYYEVKEV